MKTLTEKILSEHLVKNKMEKGSQIGIRIDQTLTQDATGTMAYLQLEALGIDKVKTDLSVSYVDHNTLQSGFENADDHKYLQTVAKKHGIYFSKPGNGICHQVHLERFGVPGKTLLGSDSHTPTGGGIGMLAIGAGGLDVACAMAGREFYLTTPQVVNVYLTGSLNKGVAAKDIILKVLSIMSVKGGVGKIIEYTGPGIMSLSVPERATITNMGAELGATTSIFPSDENTRLFLESQGRGEAYTPLSPDEGAIYDEVIEMDLDALEPMVACPHSPDNIKPISELIGLKVDQVAIGSCTNSSYSDLVKSANILKGNVMHEDVSLVVSPGSRQVFEMISEHGALTDLIASGARILESACGPCIGMGQSPKTDAVSLRTFNRNFFGRSGTKSAGVYLVSPEVAAASALTGVITDPRTIDFEEPIIPEVFKIDDRLIVKPDNSDVDVVRGPNIKPLPLNDKLDQTIDKKVMIKVEDNITTDHIMPAGAKVLPYRSNIEKISEFVFNVVDEEFYQNCIDNEGGYIVAGHNYGQGSSREHAALAPMYLGIKAVYAKSFARIHKQNLINFGILPFEFLSDTDYDQIDQFDELILTDLLTIEEAKNVTILNKTKNISFLVSHTLTTQDIDIIKAGGLLNYIRENY